MMRWSLFLVAGFVAAVLTLAQPAAAEEDSAWNQVLNTFKHKEWVLAIVEADDFARRFPKSDRAPQALYQAGCAYLMLQKAGEGGEVFKRLATQYSDSPWTLLALQLHLDAAGLVSLADELRREGRRQNSSTLTERAVGVLGVAGQRFANDNRAKGEIPYKWSECMRSLGKANEATAVLQNLTKAEQADWSKLAEFRLGDRDKFRRDMNDLLDLSANGEEQTLFLDLADRHQKELPTEAQLQCEYLRGHCMESAQRYEHFQRICKDHLGSVWAGEAALFLAEAGYAHGKRGEAKAIYRALAARHADGPRARQLAAWANWIDQHEANTKDLEELFVDSLRRFDQRAGGVAATLRIESDTLPFPIDARIAYCDRQVHVRAAWGGTGFAFGLQRPNTAWYRFMNQPIIQRIEKSALPLLTFKVDESTKDNINFQFNLAMSEDPNAVPDIAINPEVGRILARKLVADKHLQRRPRSGGGSEFVLEWPHRNARVSQSITIEFTAQRRVHAVHYHSTDAAGKKVAFALKDLVIGEPIAREEFGMPAEPGVEVRHLQQINQWEVLAQIMNLAGPTYQTLMKTTTQVR